MNGGAYPMSHGLTRLAVRFLGEPERGAATRWPTPRRLRSRRGARRPGSSRVVADEIDYDDEVRVAIEERVSLSPDALTGMEASLRFPGAGDRATARSSAGCPPGRTGSSSVPTPSGERGALTLYGKPERPVLRLQENLMQLHEKIPNNVNLSQDKRLLRALEKWQPNYLKWWKRGGPGGLPGRRDLPAHRDLGRREGLGATSTT